MKDYKVSVWIENKEHESPDKVIFVQSDSGDRRVIRDLAFQKLPTKPTSYSFDVEEVHDAKDLHVVQLNNSHEAHDDAWYFDRDGELFVVEYNKRRNVYITCHFLGNTGTTGSIKPEHCTVVTTFKAQDSY